MWLYPRHKSIELYQILQKFKNKLASISSVYLCYLCNFDCDLFTLSMFTLHVAHFYSKIHENYTILLPDLLIQKKNGLLPIQLQ